MNADPISGAMMWAGALMAFTPLAAVATVVGIVWYQKRKNRAPRA